MSSGSNSRSSEVHCKILIALFLPTNWANVSTDMIISQDCDGLIAVTRTQHSYICPSLTKLHQCWLRLFHHQFQRSGVSRTFSFHDETVLQTPPMNLQEHIPVWLERSGNRQIFVLGRLSPW